MELNELMRMSHVKRWGIVNTSRPQSLAEHSFNVILISTQLAQAMKWNGMMHPSQLLHLVTWAMLHDSVEVFTGDTPTPHKAMLRQHGANLRAAEESYSRGYYEAANKARGTVVAMVTKLADTMEAVHFLKDHGVGDHARLEVLPLLRQQLEESIDKYSAEHPDLDIRAACRTICKELAI